MVVRPFGAGTLFPAPAPGEAVHVFRGGRMVITGPRGGRLLLGFLLLTASLLLVGTAALGLVTDRGTSLLLAIVLGVGILAVPPGFLLLGSPPWRIEVGTAGLRVSKGGTGRGRLLRTADLEAVLVVPDVLLDVGQADGLGHVRVEEIRIGVLLRDGSSVGLYATQLPWEVASVAGGASRLLGIPMRHFEARLAGETMPADPPTDPARQERLAATLRRQAERHMPTGL